MQERHIQVRRTARYHLLGDPAQARELWVVVHGYGQLARFFLNKFKGLERQRLLAAPEGLSRFYLDAEHQRVGATWMTREDRLLEIQDHVAYLDDLVEALRKEVGTDLPVKALGFSQGVATVTRWSLQGNTPLQHLVLWAGSLPAELDPGTLARWRAVPVELVLGDADEYARPMDLQRMEQRLLSAGIQVRSHLFQGGHTLEPTLLDRLINVR